MKVVFDLDGTLVDTRAAVRAAYLEVGVEMPQWAWGLPWQSWLPRILNDTETFNESTVTPLEAARERHQRKNACYHKHLEELMTALPCLDVAVKSKAPIITGASPLAVLAITHVIGGPLNVKMFGCTRENKAEWLARNGWGTYVDDDVITRDYIREVTTWKVLSPEEFLRSF